MKLYWDSSGIIIAAGLGLQPEGLTRAHSVAEFLATLTGKGIETPEGKRVRSSPQEAMEAASVFDKLTFVDLSGEEVLAALRHSADRRIVEGAAVHDYLHCLAAEKAGADKIITGNLRDFSRLTELPIGSPGPSPPPPIQPGS